MARPLRIQFENAYYHVICRGNGRQDIFGSEQDYGRFLELLKRSSEVYQVHVIAYALMRNHFHLLVKTPLGNLQEFMRHFNISYTSYYNRAHRRSGHLYQGRYKSYLIDADSYLLEVSRYIHLNAVRTRDASDLTVEEKRTYLRNYRWSTYPGYLSAKKSQGFVNYQILNGFGGDTPAGRSAHRRFVEGGLTKQIENPMEKAKGHGIIGDEQFLDNVKGLVVGSRASREVPAIGRLQRVEVDKILLVVERCLATDRRELLRKRYRGIGRYLLMELLYRFAHITQAKIGELMGIDYSSVSVGRKRLHAMLERDENLQMTFNDISRELNDRSDLSAMAAARQ
jgi:REP element-mobilizing transposase RayT